MPADGMNATSQKPDLGTSGGSSWMKLHRFPVDLKEGRLEAA